MPIEFKCSACASQLRVPEAYAGKSAKCPKCSVVNSIPHSSESVAASTLGENTGVENDLRPPGKPVAKRPAQRSSAEKLKSGIAAGGIAAKPVPTKFAPAKDTPTNPYTSGPAISPTAAAVVDPLQAFQPLYESKFFIKILGWSYLLAGIFTCLTIVGILWGWVLIWAGIVLLNACKSLENGYPAGNAGMLYEGAKNLSTFFKILGVMAIIGLVVMALYFAVIVLFILVGITGAMAQ